VCALNKQRIVRIAQIEGEEVPLNKNEPKVKEDLGVLRLNYLPIRGDRRTVLKSEQRKERQYGRVDVTDVIDGANAGDFFPLAVRFSQERCSAGCWREKTGDARAF